MKGLLNELQDALDGASDGEQGRERFTALAIRLMPTLLRAVFLLDWLSRAASIVRPYGGKAYCISEDKMREARALIKEMK